MQHYHGFVADSARWEGFDHRDDDIVISTPSKCGTTWMQMLVALLLFDGEPPGPVGTLSPWVDMRIRSRAALEELVAAQRHRRFLKTHVPLDGLPLEDRVTYVVVGRDPRDVWLSMLDHRANLDVDRVVELVGEQPDPGAGPDETDTAARFLSDVVSPRGEDHTDVQPSGVLHHLATGWSRRTAPNVALFHYADLVADLPAELARLADVLGIAVSDADIARYAARADLGAMRAGGEGAVPESRQIWLDPASFFARGRVGEWRTVLPEDALVVYDDAVARLYPDEDFLGWAHGGRRGSREWRSTDRR